jgi:magnesium transporter
MRTFTAVEPDAIRPLLERQEFFWLDLQDPGGEQLRAAAELLSIDSRALASSLRFDQHTKLRSYGSFVYLVAYGAQERQGDLDELVEVHVFVSGNWILTHRHGACGTLDDLHGDIAGIEALTEEKAVAEVIGALVSSLDDFVDRLHERVDEFEQRAIDGKQPASRRRLLELRSRLALLDRIARRERDLMGRAIDEIIGLQGLERARTPELRDVADRAIRLGDHVAGLRDRLTYAVDVYNNAVMERLTIVATFFLPLGVVTGFFGMNFEWLVQHIDTLGAFLVFGIGGLAAACLFVVALLWGERLLGRSGDAGGG